MGTAAEGHRALVVPVEGPVREVVLADDAGSIADGAVAQAIEAPIATLIGEQDIFTASGRVRLALWSGHGDGAPTNERVRMMLRRPGHDIDVRGDIVVTGAAPDDVTSLPAAAVEALLARWS